MMYRLLLCLLLPFLLVGCNRDNMRNVERAPDGGVDITIEINQADVNDIVTRAIAAIPNELMRNPRAELQNGQIVVYGDRERIGGNERVQGSLTFTMVAQEGAILTQITDVTFDGLTIQDEVVRRLNDNLSQGFLRRADPNNRLVTVRSVTISPNNVRVVINAQRDS